MVWMWVNAHAFLCSRAHISIYFYLFFTLICSIICFILFVVLVWISFQANKNASHSFYGIAQIGEWIYINSGTRNKVTINRNKLLCDGKTGGERDQKSESAFKRYVRECKTAPFAHCFFFFWWTNKTEKKKIREKREKDRERREK